MSDREFPKRVPSNPIHDGVREPLQRKPATAMVKPFPDLREIAEKGCHPLYFV
jgi:hypothetical protein